MILLDPRKGSGELLDAMNRKVETVSDSNLPAGDLVFEGFVEAGRGLIGVERKKIYKDLYNSLLSGRFSGFQLSEMCDYFSMSYLIVEGIFRPNAATGVLEIWNRGGWTPMQHGSKVIMYKDVDHWLLTLMNKTPIRVIRTGSPEETVQQVADLYTWFNDKTWNKHTGHLAIYNGPEPGQKMGFKKPSWLRKIACVLPGLGYERSIAVEKAFRSIWHMANATVKEWEAVEGVGKKTAEKVWGAIRESAFGYTLASLPDEWRCPFHEEQAIEEGWEYCPLCGHYRWT